MTAPLEWIEKEVAIGDLNEFAFNPRTITKKAFNKLVDSIKQDGYHGRMLVDADNYIIAGHQRKKALLSAGYRETDSVKVLYPSRALTHEEFKRINIRDNLEFGDFDMDMLSNHFDAEFLKDIGLDIDFETTALDLEPAKLDDIETDKLCKKCPYREAA